MVITPTVGRIVWYFPTVHDGMLSRGDQPFAAQVVFVHNDRMVNLLVTDHLGNTYPRERITLVQEGDPHPSKGGHCEWMPYQAAQAKKHEAAS